MIHDGLAITTEVGALSSVAPKLTYRHHLAELTAGADQHADKS